MLLDPFKEPGRSYRELFKDQFYTQSIKTTSATTTSSAKETFTASSKGDIPSIVLLDVHVKEGPDNRDDFLAVAANERTAEAILNYLYSQSTRPSKPTFFALAPFASEMPESVVSNAAGDAVKIPYSYDFERFDCRGGVEVRQFKFTDQLEIANRLRETFTNTGEPVNKCTGPIPPCGAESKSTTGTGAKYVHFCTKPGSDENASVFALRTTTTTTTATDEGKYMPAIEVPILPDTKTALDVQNSIIKAQGTGACPRYKPINLWSSEDGGSINAVQITFEPYNNVSGKRFTAVLPMNSGAHAGNAESLRLVNSVV